MTHRLDIITQSLDAGCIAHPSVRVQKRGGTFLHDITHMRQENIHAAMETEIHCYKKDMLLINYEAPDGKKQHNHLWNGGNGFGTVKLYDKKDGKLVLVDVIEATHVGCEYGEYGE